MTQNPPDMKVRLSAILRQQVEEAARRNNRTLNSEIVSRLERSFLEEADALSKSAAERLLQIGPPHADGDQLQELERRVSVLEKILDTGCVAAGK
jgi:hypothetical protein